MRFTHRRRALASAVAVGAIAVAGTAYAATPEKPYAGSHVRTIQLAEASATPDLTFVDLDKPGPSRGDKVVTSDKLVYENGTPAGVLTQDCTITQPGTNPITSTFECYGSLVLEDGTITNSGPFVPTAPEQSLAVTGGTGEFATARGEVVIRAEQDQITVRLVR